MAKGKKRDKDKKEVNQPEKDSTPLSMTDPAPSTSEASVSEPQLVEDGTEGLGLGLPRKSRKKKQKPTESKETVEPMVVVTSPTEATTAVSSPGQITQEVQEEFEGLGLGLPKGKSRSRKKNKQAQPSTSDPAASTSAPAPALSGQQPQPFGQHVQAPGQYPQAPGPYPQAPGQYAQAPGPFPQAPVQHQQASSSSVPASQTPPFPGPWARQASQSVPSSSNTQAATSVWQQPPMQTVGRGAGRGMGRGRGTPLPGAGDATPGYARGHPPTGFDRGPPKQELTPSSEPVSQLAQDQCAPTQQIQPVRPSLLSIPRKIPSAPNRTTSYQMVLTNYLAMKIKCNKVYRYDVAVSPDKPKKYMLDAYEKTKNQLFPRKLIAFDQTKNCYSLDPLPGVSATGRCVTNVEIVDNNNKPITFEVSFKFTGVIDFGTIFEYMKGGTSLDPPAEAIQCVDVILKQGTLQSYTKAGRQYFLRPRNPKDLGEGLEMWTGLFQSAIFTSQPFVNIDVAHKGFPRHQPILQALTQDFKLDLHRPIDEQRGRCVEAFQNFIKGLRVVAKLLGGPVERTREFICNGIVDIPDRQTFTMNDIETNQSIKLTVGEYFRKYKGYRIKYPNLNCMWVGPKDRGIFFPMELLEVAYGQARNKQLNERQLSTMVREAATPPDVRKQKIEEVISKMNYSANPYFRHFGLEISPEFFQVNSKILQPPKLDVGQSQGVIPKNGVWQAKTLLKASALESWGFVCVDLDPHSSNSDMCINNLMDVGKQMGMRVSPPRMQQFNVRVDALQRVFAAAVDKGVNFIFVIISKRGRDTYQRVKKIAECTVGVLTQCIKEITATTRMNQQTARNILLKVNSKLMGVNQALNSHSVPKCLEKGDVMIVGADVTHPSPEQRNVPSIAAVTASLDQNCFIYNIELSIQTPKEEMIMQFEDMMLDHLMLYRKRQNKLPRKVFVFRDGVSEGQYAQVMHYELSAIHRAYERLTGGKMPKPEVLFLLVQKRHHTRFFLPGNQAKYNVSPGTVVDTHIVHPTELDFYMVSHQAIKGTARPTRYHAVCNDGKIPDEEVEQLTFYLCHLYSRCMRSVSYPTPTYYAHLACLRARSLTFDETFVNQDLEKNPKRLRVLERMLQHSRMFFV